MKSSEVRTRYWLQLREEGLAARMVEYLGTGTREDGEEVILVEAGTKAGQRVLSLERSKWLIDWRTWKCPPLLEWIKRPWKEAAK